MENTNNKKREAADVCRPHPHPQTPPLAAYFLTHRRARTHTLNNVTTLFSICHATRETHSLLTYEIFNFCTVAVCKVRSILIHLSSACRIVFQQKDVIVFVLYRRLRNILSSSVRCYSSSIKSRYESCTKITLLREEIYTVD